MEEKLELRHLAPYLPYDLRYLTSDTRGESWLFAGTPPMIMTMGPVAMISILQSDGKYKPLLHPLDRLTELGNENILINEHSINKLLEEKYGLEYGFFTFYKGKIEIELEADPMLQYDQTKSFDFEVLQTIHDELFKAHYDVFGLIEKGLALPIDQK